MSLSLFMCFVTLKMNYRKSINALASATFGVYLIHENNIIRDLLWVDWFKNAQYQESLFLIPYSILAVIAVYAVCSLVDLIRITIIEKPCMKMVNRYSDKIAAPFVSIATVLKNLIFGK